MFRVAASNLKASVQISRRNFVSSVLLTRTWENESVSALRKEAKSRGLSSKGNKATLITRLQNFESGERPQPPQPRVEQVRHNSTETEVPGVPSSSEPPQLSPSFPKEFLDVKIPDTSVPIPEPPVQIPFVPDFWDSSRVQAESAPPEPEETSPSYIAVGGDTTRISVSPTYSDFAEADPVDVPATASQNQTFLQDVTEDLFFTASIKLPKVGQPKAAAEDVPQIITESSGSQRTDYSRTLDEDEVRGVWALLGLLAGSWVAAGLLKPSPAFTDKVEQKDDSVPETAAEKH